MFLNTLAINKGVVDIAMKKRSEHNVAAADGRGKGKSFTLNSALIDSIVTHIESFPCVPSHYCREDTTRKYLDSSLNLATMYRMYVTWCKENNKPIAKVSAYRNIFKDKFNLGFHRPRKDQCRICVAYYSTTSPSEEMKQNFIDHQKSKKLARQEKINDRDIATASNGKVISYNFDLQQVLLCPTDPTNNALFYKQRLSTYNYNL
nr:unnamed protein product [Callosobruchus chinensis]